jgi:TPR repeat protein
MIPMRKLIFLALVGMVVSVKAEPLPDLAQLKLAAESGDAVAEYNYGKRIYEQREQFQWFMKSAEQGYAPAQDAVAENLTRHYTSNLKERKALDRDAVRWASRAAYQGLASAQGRLSEFYRKGAGVGADPLKAYMWIQIAVQTA